MNKSSEIINRINKLGKQRKPFVLLIDFLGLKPIIFELNKSQNEIYWQIQEKKKNNSELAISNRGKVVKIRASEL